MDISAKIWYVVGIVKGGKIMGIFDYFQKKDKNIVQEETVTRVSEIHQDNFEYKAQNRGLDELDCYVIVAGRLVIE